MTVRVAGPGDIEVVARLLTEFREHEGRDERKCAGGKAKAMHVTPPGIGSTRPPGRAAAGLYQQNRRFYGLRGAFAQRGARRSANAAIPSVASSDENSSAESCCSSESIGSIDVPPVRRRASAFVVCTASGAPGSSRSRCARVSR